MTSNLLCIYDRVKVKWSRHRPGVAQRVARGIALLFHDRGTRREWVVSSTPRPHFTPEKTRYRLYRWLGGPQGRSGRAGNLVPTEIRSRTVQSVVSRYTDWATRPTYMAEYVKKIPDNLMRNLQLHNSHLRTHTYIQKRRSQLRSYIALSTVVPWICMFTWLHVFSITRYSNVTKVFIK